MHPRECCHGCGYRGSSQGVRAHIKRRHPVLAARRRVGRPQKGVCDLCGFHHDEIAGPGRAIHRRFLVKGKTVEVVGTIPGLGKHMMSVIKVPRGVYRVSQMRFGYEFCRGPFRGAEDISGNRECVKCGGRHADGAQFKLVRVRREMIGTGIRVQFDFRDARGRVSQMGYELTTQKPPTLPT